MRTIGTGNSAQPTGILTDFTDACKVEVANASDVLVDLSAYGVSLEYDSGADEIVDAATIVFRRLEDASSLAPLMTASPPVALNRRVVVTIDVGTDTKQVFSGKITDVDWPERYGDVTCQCLDQARDASRTWIETERAYGSTAGVSLETVMQAVATDNMASPPTLYFPVATSAVVAHVEGDAPYGPTEQSVLDAERALAESYGGTIRWRYIDSLSAWRWTVFTPSRTKTVPDHTFGTSAYFDVKQIKLSDADIRNVIAVEYIGAGGVVESVTVQDSVSTGGAMTATSTTLTTTGGNTFAATDVGKTIKVPGAGAAGATLTTTIATYVSATSVTLTAAASTTVSVKSVEWGSIADYGRLYAKISEGSDSPVNNNTLATALGNAALSDLKEPDVLLEISCRYFWPGEIGVDLYRFTANGKHFSTDQDLAPMQFRHRIAVGEEPTSHVMVRGKPSGGVLSWRRRFNLGGGRLFNSELPAFAITNFREIARTATAVTIGWDVAGSTLAELWLWLSTPAQPIATDPALTFTGVPTVRLTAATTSYAVTIPRQGLITYGRLMPIAADGTHGAAWDFTVQPGTAERLIQRATVTATDAATVTVLVAVANPTTGGDILITPAAVGCTVTEGAQTILTAVVTDNLGTTGSKTFTVTRPAFGSGSGRITFTATSDDRLPDIDAVDVPAVEKLTFGPTLIVTPTPGATSYSIVWSGDSVTLSIDGAAYGAPGASPITVTRNAANGADKIYAFRAVLDSQTVTDTVVIPAIGAVDTDTNTVTPDLTVTPSSPTATTQTFTASATNPSGGAAPTITYSVIGCTAAGGTITSAGNPHTYSAAVVVDRPAWDTSVQATITFKAAIASNGSSVISRTVLNQVRDTQPVQVRITRVSETGNDIVVRVAAITPNAGTTCAVTYDAAGLTITPASGGTFTSTTDFATTAYIDYTITRPVSVNGTPRRVTFTISATGFVSAADSVDVPSGDFPTSLLTGTISAAQINVANLSAINADLGVVTSGHLKNAGDTAAIRLSGTTALPATDYIDFTATGSGLFVKVGGLSITKAGAVTVTAVKFRGGGSAPTLSNVHAFYDGVSTVTGTDPAFRVKLTTATGGTQPSGNVCRVTYATAFAAAPIVVVAAGDLLAVNDVYITNQVAGSFDIAFLVGGATMAAGSFITLAFVVLGDS